MCLGEGTHKIDGLYRAMLRGDSTHTRSRARAIALELRSGPLQSEPAKFDLLETRKKIERGWSDMRDILSDQGHPELPEQVKASVERMGPPYPEKEALAARLLQQAPSVRERHRDRPR